MKIIEELHRMSMLNNGADWEDDLDKEVLTDYFSKESASIVSAKITKGIAVKFSLWQQMGECVWVLNDEDEWYNPYNDEKRITTEELFDIFIETLEKEEKL